MTGPGPAWPGGAHSVAMITVSLQGDRSILGPNPGYEGLDKTLSTARYGLRRGTDAVLDRLDRAGVPSTWFVLGRVAADHPDVVTRVRDAGAAIATGGWDVTGTAQDSPAGAAAVVTPADLDRTITALGALGIVPDGFRLPGGEWPDGLADLLLERGITWSSSFVAGERPFRLPGATGELVELPFHWAMDDRQSFVWNFAPATPRGHARIAGYDEVLDNWRAELRATHAEGGLWVLSLHPEIIGTPGRVALLDEILAEVAATSGCRVVTGPELAGWWAEHGAPDPAAHPMRRFLAASGRTHL